jgi:hypothetical protein
LRAREGKPHKFDPNLFEGLSVIFEAFNADDQSLCADDDEHSTSFLPMKLEALEAYKPNLSQPNTDYLIKTYLGEWGSQSTYPKVNYHNAGELC